MAVLRLLVRRKEYAEITVTVPDGTRPEAVMAWTWQKEIARAVEELAPTWEADPDEGPDVEQAALLEGEEAVRELHDYRHVALVPPVEKQPSLRAMEKARKLAAALAARDAKAKQEEQA